MGTCIWAAGDKQKVDMQEWITQKIKNSPSATCARHKAQPKHWTRAKPASSVGRLEQQRTTPWEAQTNLNLHKKKHMI